ncbi:MAG: radical SAM protein [Myxococcota bacterium]|jgi:hypothetical protein|nr:radical SAM protein [Myxococcota bacterium]
MTQLRLLNTCRDLGEQRSLMPLACLSLQASVEAAGFTCKLEDLQFEKLGEDTLRRHPEGCVPGMAYNNLGEQAKRPIDENLCLEDIDALTRWFFREDAELLGISLMSHALPFVLLALEQGPLHRPPVVLGGSGVAFVAASIMQRFEAVDFIIEGEAELALVELLRALRGERSMEGIPGLWRRQNGHLLPPTSLGRIAELALLPPPSAASTPLEVYDVLSLHSARGCPFRCAFCSAGALAGHRVRSLPISRVLDEAQALAARCPSRTLIVEDDTFLLRRSRVLAFCEGLHERGLSFDWGCTGRVGLLDEALLERMAAAGCSNIFLGIESGSDRLLSSIDKGFRVEQGYAQCLLAARYMRVTAHFVWGFPTERLEDFAATYVLMMSLFAQGINVRASNLVPFPGSPLVEQQRDPQDGTLRLLAPSQTPYPRLLNVEPGSRAGQLVLSDAELFLPFYSLPTPALEEKRASASRFHALFDAL